MKRSTAWGALWVTDNRLDGHREELLGDGRTVRTWRTRAEARVWIKKEYGYFRTRYDLRAEPHGWRMPRAVRVPLASCVRLARRRAGIRESGVKT